MIFKRCITSALLLSGLVFGSAHAMTMSVDGIAVENPGATTMVGLNGSGSLSDWIKYYIPLNTANNGTYGSGGPCTNGAGTCSDSGYGSQLHYDDADALFMNIYFDMTGKGESSSASLSFQFDDLDLTPGNDPTNFFESVSLAYFDTVINDFVDLSGGTIKAAIAPPAGDNPEQQADDNLVLWALDLAAIDALNASVASDNGFWIQLGFGSLYDIPQCDQASLGSTQYASYTSDSYGGAGGGGGGYYRDCKDPWNTPEYLTAELKVTAVPVPASVWLFGTALIGFIGIARRTRIS